MAFRFSTLIAFVFGFTALSLLAYYYYIENDFRINYKAISAQFNSLQKDQERVSYGILQSVLFAYYNQDVIAKDRKNLKVVIKELAQHPLLHNKHYQPLKKTIAELQFKMADYIELIEDHLMSNAGIKNSMVFLSTYEVNAREIFPVGSEPLEQIHSIIDSIVQARRMLDNSYLTELPEYKKKLLNNISTEEQEAYIKVLLIHTDFLEKKYPLYIDIFSQLMNSSLREKLAKAQQQFEELAQEDVDYLNTLAISLFILIFIATMVIILLLYHSQKENVKLHHLHNKLQFTLKHDGLTGLLNRHSYDQSLDALSQPVILLININRFKMVNEFFGTEHADQLLIEVSTLLKQKFFQKPEICYRISGDEFVVVFEKQTSGYIDTIASEVNNILTERDYVFSGIKYNTRINMAISRVKPLLETADMALKKLKERPVGNIIHYTSELDIREQIQSNIEMTQMLYDALNENRLIPYYQPIINLKTREIVKYEALVRLKLPNGKILSPLEFLPVAQQTPLYHEITRVMITKTIAYFSDKPYRFSINFSMSDLEDDDIVNILIAQFAAYPDVVSRMDIELLESEMLTDMGKVKDFIGELKRLGCGISIDDFGSGYSNFSNLTELDLDVIKIDGSLIKEISHSSEHYKTVKAIMGLVAEMGIESVAEFVQDEASAKLLSDLGVTYAQGYYFGKPDEFIANL